MKTTYLIAVSTLILQENSSRFISNSHDSSRCWIAVYIITLKKVIWFPRREETAALPLISWTPSAPLVTAAVYSQKEWKKTWPSILNGLDCTEKKWEGQASTPAYIYLYICILHRLVSLKYVWFTSLFFKASLSSRNYMLRLYLTINGEKLQQSPARHIFPLHIECASCSKFCFRRGHCTQWILACMLSPPPTYSLTVSE